MNYQDVSRFDLGQRYIFGKKVSLEAKRSGDVVGLRCDLVKFHLSGFVCDGVPVAPLGWVVGFANELAMLMKMLMTCNNYKIFLVKHFWSEKQSKIDSRFAFELCIASFGKSFRPSILNNKLPFLENKKFVLFQKWNKAF